MVAGHISILTGLIRTSKMCAIGTTIPSFGAVDCIIPEKARVVVVLILMMARFGTCEM